MKKISRIVWASVLAVVLLFNTAQNTYAGVPGPWLQNCVGGTKGFSTAIGCIPFMDDKGNAQTNEIAKFFLAWGLGIGGGIAFVLMIVASFQIMTSSGDPHRLQAGKELLTSAISGLILLILSIYILRIVGVNIFGII